jgi:hypothetical protein
MRRRKTNALIATAVLSLAFLPLAPATAQTTATPAAAPATATPAQTTAAKPSRSFLFALEGKKATLQPVAGKPGTYRLTAPLKALDERVNWFADRPARDAGTLPLTQFIALWAQDGKDSFKNDPPNIALAHDNRTLIAEMTNPQIVNGDSGKNFQATLKTLPTQKRTALGNGSGNLSLHAQRGEIESSKSTQQLGNFSIFIDNEAGCSGDCCCYCIGGSNCGEDCYPGVNGLTICPVICGTNCNDYCAIFG